MYQKEYELRYSDINSSGDIKTCTVLDILQDVSVAHADFTGLTQKLEESSVACFLGGWRIRFCEKLSSKAAVKADF